MRRRWRFGEGIAIHRDPIDAEEPIEDEGPEKRKHHHERNDDAAADRHLVLAKAAPGVRPQRSRFVGRAHLASRILGSRYP